MESSVLRILDANLNRSREALRVIEDHARFVLDDADVAQRVKIVRHGLRQIAEALGPAELLAARDIVNDVGRDAKTTPELHRASTDDVVRAAFARLAEATRVLGEYGKLVSPVAAQTAEKLRYETYELEQRVVLRGALRLRFRRVRLYVIVTEAVCRRGWYETAEAALRGGAGCLQLREKDLSDAELLRRARRLRDLAVQRGALLIVNDRPDIAELCRADGVHVGQDDLSVAEVRRTAGANVLVGKSTHRPAQFDAALAEAPDYLAVGPMFASPTKPQDHIAGPQTLAEVAKRAQIPLVGIGGVTADNIAEVIRAGASCVCVCSAVIGAEDVAAAAATILERVRSTVCPPQARPRSEC
ncbi:MAG: thiamine phosphate synthase [Phycisphaerae bacterium]